MLLHLAVDNLVLIDRLQLELAPGFNVLTGETGAGKSMLVGALGLVLGGRARPDLVRRGAKEAEVAAQFELPPSRRAATSRAVELLAEWGIPCERTERGVEVLVRRVVHAEGRSRAFVNGRACTAAQLAELARDLVDVASQHESVSLTDPTTHLEYLDAFGELDDARDVVARHVEELSRLAKTLSELRALEAARAAREDVVRVDLAELEELDAREGEDIELDAERMRLRHAERLRRVTRAAAERLYDVEGAICDELGRHAAELGAAAELDEALAEPARLVEAARSELAEVARNLARYAEAIESSPARLEEIDERLFRLQKALRRHGPTVVELTARRQELARELAAIATGTERVAELESQISSGFERAAELARQLSASRRVAAERLGEAIGQELALLGMGSARVLVDVAPTQGVSELPQVDGARLSGSGIDRVEFLIAPNVGEEPRPLRRIASGGELSRALLALKRVMADIGPAGLYVFDEVDAGVSGAIAEVIGRSVADVARHRQVLCITHLPQIAALADAHYLVEKTERGSRTSTHVRRLSADERVGEIARMLGGVRVGDAARSAARELIAGAGAARPSVRRTRRPRSRSSAAASNAS
ncbi:MAG: DNA repair protein RecN [Myxococcales bacterium]|nr:DNA repair protein RecN [Myxococcales bacterium]